eukprot:gene28611-35498_t
MLHRVKQNILYLWVVFNDSLSLIGCKLPTANASGNITSKNMQQFFYFDVKATNNTFGDFQRAQDLFCLHTSSIVDRSSLIQGLNTPVFSYEVYVLGSKGSIVVGAIETPQEKLSKHITTLGDRAFSQPDSPTDCALSVDYFLLDAAGVRVEPLSTDPDASVLNVTNTFTTALSGLPLWRAVLQLEALAPDRIATLRAMTAKHDQDCATERLRVGNAAYDSTAEKNSERILGRLVVMESTLSLVQTHANGYDTQFVLSDVKRVHEWAVRTTVQSNRVLQSVQGHLEAIGYDLCVKFIAPLLLSRESRNERSVSSEGEVSRDLPLSVESELSAHIRSLSGLRVVLEALLTRKASAIEGERGGDIMQGVIEEASSELRVRLLEVTTLQDTLRTLHALCTRPEISLNCLLTSDDVEGAQLQSLYNASKSERLTIGAELRHVPEALHGGLLLDELRALLDPNLVSLTEFSNTSDVTVLATAVSNFLFLPLAALKAANVLLQNSTDSVIDARLLSEASASQESVPLVALSSALGSASKMPSSLSRGVTALFRIDSSIQVYEAVCDVLDVSHTNILQDESMLLAVIKRAICANHLDEARRVTSHLSAIRHALMDTQIGVLSHAVCLTHKHSWQVVWHDSRKLASRFSDDLLAAQTRQLLVRIVGLWTLKNGELSGFLTSSVDSDELQAVIALLSEWSDKEIGAFSVQSPCVDLQIGYLLQQNLFEEAVKVHEKHEAAIKTQPLSTVHAASASLHTRRTLLNAHLAMSRVKGRNVRDVTGHIHSDLITSHSTRPSVITSTASFAQQTGRSHDPVDRLFVTSGGFSTTGRVADTSTIVMDEGSGGGSVYSSALKGSAVGGGGVATTTPGVKRIRFESTHGRQSLGLSQIRQQQVQWATPQ